MTYQELLDEFCKRRDSRFLDPTGAIKMQARLNDLEWAIQSILEKLRDQESSK